MLTDEQRTTYLTKILHAVRPTLLEHWQCAVDSRTTLLQKMRAHLSDSMLAELEEVAAPGVYRVLIVSQWGKCVFRMFARPKRSELN